MSAVISMVCTDGVVLAADKQITVPGYFKYHKTKIDGLEGKGWTVAYAYAGSPDLMKEATERIFGKIKPDNPNIDPNMVRAVAETELETMGYRFTEFDLDLILVTTTATEIETVRFAGSRKAFYATTGIEILGVGESSLLTYLASLLYEQGKTDISFGVLAATYMVEKAKEYIDGCGGDTDLLIVKKGNQLDTWSFVDRVASYIRMRKAEATAIRDIVTHGTVPSQ
ncbi:MAG TPA: hypothetical protein VGY31_13455 [Terriglobia bacterium]|nr:hypothetical protein [Terriglobia bacterium]